VGMTGSQDFLPALPALAILAMDDASLLRECDVHIYKSSGPGGQHRNKVSSAVRLRHRATGITAHGDDTRSQHENKRMAIRRLRMNLALRLRGDFDPAGTEVPAVVNECMFAPRGKKGASAGRRMRVGRRDHRFWAVAAFLLDVLEGFAGRLGDAARWLGISTGNLTSVFKSDRHLLAAAGAIRKAHGHKPLS